MMLRPLNINLLTGLVVAIILLGAISVLTVMVNAHNYRDLAFDFQRQYMTQLMAAESSAILTRNAEYARRMGLEIQQDEVFREAFAASDSDRLETALQAQHHAAALAFAPLTSVAIYAFDAQFRLIARTMDAAGGIDNTALICPDLISKAQVRAGTQRLKPLHELCLYSGVPFHASVVAVGGPDPAGYLQIVDDPVPALTRIGELLKMPVQISLADGTVLFAAPGWESGAASNSVISGYTLAANNARPALQITAARNADALLLQIRETNQGLLRNVVLVLLSTLAEPAPAPAQ
jgi:hypothetical protein